MPKSQAGHVLKIFLNFWEISAWCSYKLGSYKKKSVSGKCEAAAAAAAMKKISTL